jgi:hypothetical protein
MHQLSQILKHLKDTGIIDAIIENKPIEQRCMAGHDYMIPDGWHPWAGSQTILLDGGNSWEVRVRPQPREWWIWVCPKHQPQYRVASWPIQKECDECKVIHAIEKLD